jgi:hypothetical protein
MDFLEASRRRELPCAAKLADSNPPHRLSLALNSSSDAAAPAFAAGDSGGAVRRRLMLSAIRRWRFRAASRAVSQRLARRDPLGRAAAVVVQARTVAACSTNAGDVLPSPSSSLSTTLSAQRSEAFRAAIQRARDVAHAAEEPYRAARNAAQHRREVRQTAAATQRTSAAAQRSASARRHRSRAGGSKQESPKHFCEPWEPPPSPTPPGQVGAADVGATQRRRQSTFQQRTHRTSRSASGHAATAPRASEHRKSLSGAAAWADAHRAGRTGVSVPGVSPASAGRRVASDDMQSGRKPARPATSPACKPSDGREGGPAGGATSCAAGVDPELREVGCQIARVRAAVMARGDPHTARSFGFARMREDVERGSRGPAEGETSPSAAGAAVSCATARSSPGRPSTASASSVVTHRSDASAPHAESTNLHTGTRASGAVDIRRLGEMPSRSRRTLRALDGNMAVLRLRRCVVGGTAAPEHYAVGCREALGSVERHRMGSQVRRAQHKQSGGGAHVAVGSAVGGSSGVQFRGDRGDARPLESGRVGSAFAQARAAELHAETEAAREVFSYLAGDAGAAKESGTTADSGGEGHRTLGRETLTPGERAVAGANAAAAAAQAAAAEARRLIADEAQSHLRRVMDFWRCWVLRHRWARQAGHATRLRFVSDGTKQSLVKLRRTRSFEIPRARHRLPHQRSPAAMSGGISSPQSPHGLGRQRQSTAEPVQSKAGEASTPGEREPASWDALLHACATLGCSNRTLVQGWLVSPAAAARLMHNAGV